MDQNGFLHITKGARGYSRSCTAADIALLDASHAIERAGKRAAEDAERDDYFADLAADLEEGKAPADDALAP